MDKAYIFKNMIKKDEFIEVTSDKFYELIGCLNVEVRPQGNYPYVSTYTLKTNRLIVGYQYGGNFILKSMYNMQ